MTAPASDSPTRPCRVWLAWIASGALILSAGCQIIPDPAPDPTRYFVLTGPVPASAADSSQGTLRLGLRPVELPAYLESRSLVIRNGRNEVAYDDFARWAEPLEAGIARVLRARLMGTPEVLRVYSHPFPFDRERDYDINVNVIRCEGTRETAGALVQFAAVVEIVAAKSGDVISRRVVSAPDLPWDGTNHAALVEALSESVGHLAHEVVNQLPDSRPSVK